MPVAARVRRCQSKRVLGELGARRSVLRGCSASAAASSRTAAISASGLSVESARWRARSSGSATTTRRDVRAHAVARRRTPRGRPTDASSGCVKRIVPSVRSITRAARRRIEHVLGDIQAREAARRMDGPRPLRAAATACVAGAAPSRRARTSPVQRLGNAQRLRGVDVRAQSPGELERVERVSTGRLVHAQEGRAWRAVSPRCAWRSWCSGAEAERADVQPLDSVGRRSPARAPAPPHLRRGDARAAGGSAARRSRRSANASALAEDGSSHWTSSIARTTGPSAARTSSALRPRRRACADRTPSGSSSTRSASSSARRLGVGSAGRHSSSTSSNRSPSPAWVSPRSASAGRDIRTSKPRSGRLDTRVPYRRLADSRFAFDDQRGRSLDRAVDKGDDRSSLRPSTISCSSTSTRSRHDGDREPARRRHHIAPHGRGTEALPAVSRRSQEGQGSTRAGEAPHDAAYEHVREAEAPAALGVVGRPSRARAPRARHRLGAARIPCVRGRRGRGERAPPPESGGAARQARQVDPVRAHDGARHRHRRRARTGSRRREPLGLAAARPPRSGDAPHLVPLDSARPPGRDPGLRHVEDQCGEPDRRAGADDRHGEETDRPSHRPRRRRRLRRVQGAHRCDRRNRGDRAEGDPVEQVRLPVQAEALRRVGGLALRERYAAHGRAASPRLLTHPHEPARPVRHGHHARKPSANRRRRGRGARSRASGRSCASRSWAATWLRRSRPTSPRGSSRNSAGSGSARRARCAAVSEASRARRAASPFSSDRRTTSR